MRVYPLTSTYTSRLQTRAYTILEVAMAIALTGIVVAGMVYSYAQVTRRNVWNALSVAAEAEAVSRYEQTTLARWNVTSRGDQGIVDELTNYVGQTGARNLPATNYTTITMVSSNPPLRIIRVDCVWSFNGTLVTNTIQSMRAPDQ